MERILDAAARSFAERGFDATTMESIADGAGTSIGSVYQFFRKKPDVFQAVAERALETIRTAFFAESGAGTFERPWREQVDRLIDLYAHVESESVDVRALNANVHLYGLYQEQDLALMRQLAELFATGIASLTPELNQAARQRVALSVIEYATSVFFFRRLAPPQEAAARLEEGKRMVMGYLAGYLD